MADQNRVNRFQSYQYHCVACGFRTSAKMFDKGKNEKGDEIVICSECGSAEIVDADTRQKINPG